MVESGFPPGRVNLNASVILMHVGLLLALLGVIAGFFFQLRRKAAQTDLAIWTIAGVVFVVLSVSLTREIVRQRPETALFANWLIVLIALTCLAGFAQPLFQLSRSGQANPAFWILACLLFLVLTIPVLEPFTPQGQESARVVQCRIHLKQIARALDAYHNGHRHHDGYREFPPTAQGDLPASWRVKLLPYLDRRDLYETYDFSKAWDARPNDLLQATPISEYTCPSVPLQQGKHFTAYIAPTGNDTIMRPDRSLAIQDIHRGTANTLIIVEACGLEILWPEPRDFDLAKQPIGMNLRGTGTSDSPGVMSAYHYGGVNVAAADGSVRLLSQKTDPEVLRQLLSATGQDSAKTSD